MPHQPPAAPTRAHTDEVKKCVECRVHGEFFSGWLTIDQQRKVPQVDPGDPDQYLENWIKSLQSANVPLANASSGPDADKKDWGFLYKYLLTNAPWHVMRHRTGGCNDGYLIACPRCSAELFISTPSIGKDGNDSKHINEIQRRLIEFLWGSWARFAELYPYVAKACKDSFCTVETLVPGRVVAYRHILVDSSDGRSNASESG